MKTYCVLKSYVDRSGVVVVRRCCDAARLGSNPQSNN